MTLNVTWVEPKIRYRGCIHFQLASPHVFFQLSAHDQLWCRSRAIRTSVYLCLSGASILAVPDPLDEKQTVTFKRHIAMTCISDMHPLNEIGDRLASIHVCSMQKPHVLTLLYKSYKTITKPYKTNLPAKRKSTKPARPKLPITHFNPVWRSSCDLVVRKHGAHCEHLLGNCSCDAQREVTSSALKKYG